LLATFGIELAGTAVPEALAQSGFDALIIDTEHSALDLQQVLMLITACRGSGLASIVRVSDHSRGLITRVADMCPDGMMFPGVASRQEAEDVVQLAKYAPLGARGVCPMVRYSALGADRYAVLNDRLALILQIEGAAALEEAGDIAGVSGVDALFVGTYDLSQSLGIPGAIDDPRVLAAGARVREILGDNAALGVYVSTATMAEQWLSLGATFIAYATDGQLFLSACQTTASTFHEAVRSSETRPS